MHEQECLLLCTMNVQALGAQSVDGGPPDLFIQIKFAGYDNLRNGRCRIPVIARFKSAVDEEVGFN